MKAFFPADPIVDSNTLDVKLTAADARVLVDMVATDAAFMSKLSGRLVAQLSRLQDYLADRDAGEHCFVSMGDPFKEAHMHGYAVRHDPQDAAKLDFRNGTVTEGGQLADHGRTGGKVVAMIGHRADGDPSKPSDSHERRRWVHPVAYNRGNEWQYEMVRVPYGHVEEVYTEGDRYAVVNPGQPTVYRPDYTTAVLTCYLRGKAAAERKAATKVAGKKPERTLVRTTPKKPTAPKARAKAKAKGAK